MAILVEPTKPYSTHDIRLTKGSADIGLILCDQRGRPSPLGMQEQPSARTAMRVAQGAGGYGDFELPYTPLVQGDFSGGMGGREFESDTTRFYDCHHADTSRGILMPAGAKQETSGYKTTVTKAGSTEISPGGTYRVSSSFIPSSTFTARYIDINYACDSVSLVYVAIFSDSGGSPNTEIVKAYFLSEITTGATARVTLNAATSLTASTTYHTVILATGATGFHIYTGAETGNAVKQYIAGWSTIYADSTLAYTISSAGIGTALFFELKGLLHAINRGDDGAAPTLWRNGYTAAVRATTTDNTKVNTSLSFSGVNLAGKVIKIVAGPGVNEQQPWRVITSNTTTGTNDTITVSPAWNTAHTTGTVFVILGTDTWTACTVTPAVSGGLAPSKPITDLSVIDDKLYLCQGVDADITTAANVCSVTVSVAAAGPTYTGADEGAQRDLVRAFVDTDGVKKVITAVSGTRIVYRNLTTALVSTGTAAPMNGGLACGTSGARITGIQIYDEPPRPYLFFEDEIGSISNNVYSPIRLTEMPAVRSESNGRAACTSDKYLFFSLGEGIERYYSGILDDIGPDRGEGLPSDRRGNPVHMVAYPGGIIYAAIDAGDAGYSSILKYNGSGWCEIYRAALGVRIRRLYIQNIAGIQYQRLWFSEEEDISWIPVAKNPLQASGFKYASSCTLTTAWMQTAYKDIRKFWNSLKLFTVNASATRYVTVEYQTDDETSWHALADAFDASPSEEHTLTSTYTATGIKLRFRLTLTTPSPYTTPVYVERMVTEAVTRVPPKRAWAVNVLLASYGKDANGDIESLTAQAKHAILRDLSNSGTQADPVLMRTRNPNADNLYVFVEPSSVRPIRMESDPAKPDVVNLVCTFSLVEA